MDPWSSPMIEVRNMREELLKKGWEAAHSEVEEILRHSGDLEGGTEG